MTWDCDGVVITNFVVHLSNTFPATMLHLHTCQLHAHSVIALQENRKQSKWRHKGTYEHGPYSGHFYSHTRHHCFLVRPVWSLPVSSLPTLLFSSLRGPAKFVPCHYYGQMVWAPISCHFFLKRMPYVDEAKMNQILQLCFSPVAFRRSPNAQEWLTALDALGRVVTDLSRV